MLAALIFGCSSLVLAVGDEFWNFSVGMILNGLGKMYVYVDDDDDDDDVISVSC